MSPDQAKELRSRRHLYPSIHGLNAKLNLVIDILLADAPPAIIETRTPQPDPEPTADEPIVIEQNTFDIDRDGLPE